MVFVERISHITAQVEYGLIPANSQLRRYDEKGGLIGNEGMELLSPTVFEDTVRGTFFFAEKRPLLPTANPTQAKKGDGKGDKIPGKKGEEEQLKRTGGKGSKKKSDDVQNKGKADKDTVVPPSIPTLLEQLVKLRVLKIIPNIRCKSIQHRGACLVRVLLTESEVSAPLLSLNVSTYMYPRSPIHAPVHAIHIFSTKPLCTHGSRYAPPCTWRRVQTNGMCTGLHRLSCCPLPPRCTLLQ
jgi:hypothetical protein